MRLNTSHISGDVQRLFTPHFLQIPTLQLASIQVVCSYNAALLVITDVVRKHSGDGDSIEQGELLGCVDIVGKNSITLLF